MPDYSRHHQQVGRIGGLTRAALGTNEEGRKAAAQAARMKRYLDKVPADVTDPDERARRAHLLLRADMSNLGRRSGIARRKATPSPARKRNAA